LTNQQNITVDDLREVGQGAGTFVSQFKPNAMNRVSAKHLLIDDKDYSSTQDHYFSYINKNKVDGP